MKKCISLILTVAFLISCFSTFAYARLIVDTSAYTGELSLIVTGTLKGNTTESGNREFFTEVETSLVFDSSGLAFPVDSVLNLYVSLSGTGLYELTPISTLRERARYLEPAVIEADIDINLGILALMSTYQAYTPGSGRNYSPPATNITVS